MNYKRILPSREIRMSILDFLSWLPDVLMVKLQYRIHVGRKLSLKNPKRFTEKLQWYKLHYRKIRLRNCVEKEVVKNYNLPCF